MDTFKKILNLIPDNWEEVLTQSSEFEAHLDPAQQVVHTFGEHVKKWTIQLLPLLKVDWEVIQYWFEQTRVYQELEKVKVDVPAWSTVPDGFDWEDENQRKAFLNDKTILLKATIKDLSIRHKNDTRVDLNLAIDQLRDVADVLIHWFENLDVTDPHAEQQFKSKAMEQLRPKVYALIQTLTGLDLQNQPTKKDSPTFDNRLHALVDLPEKIIQRQPDELTSGLPEEMAKAVQTIHRVQHAMPAIHTQLQKAAPELSPVLSYMGDLEHATDHLKTHFPLIAKAVQNLLSGEDWEDLNIEKLTSEVKTLFTTIHVYLESSPSTQHLLDSLGQLQQALPVQWVRFEEGLTAEQKWSQWLKEAKAIFSLPEDIDDQSPEQLLIWIQDKLEGVARWINQVAFMGGTINDFYQRAKSPIEQLMSTDGADLNSAVGMTNFALDKLKLILDWISPISEEDAEKDATTKDNNPAQAESAGFATETSTTQPSKGLMPTLVSGLREAIEKGQLVWQFIKENDLGIRLEDQPEGFQPTALQPTSFQVNSGAADSQENVEEDLNQDTTTRESARETDADSSVNAREMISWEQVIFNLLGDRESGVIACLSKDKQEIAMQLKNETLLQELEEEFKKRWDASGIYENFQSKYKGFKDKVSAADQEQISVADLLSQLLSSVGDLYDAALEFIQQVVQFLLSLLVKLIDLLFEVIKAFTVPAEVKELLPRSIEEALFSDQDPNLICLFAAMPTVLVKGLLSVPLGEMREWIEAA